MERNLKFLKTMSVAEFKAQHNVEKIEVKEMNTLANVSLSMALKLVLVQGRWRLES